ncbi:choice-of-anchor J domain-containing protein [candidate division KSB1 bacterium]|nr:choice-of-anchor J domain-containing protein [candidate division KSB1 bacterium]
MKTQDSYGNEKSATLSRIFFRLLLIGIILIPNFLFAEANIVWSEKWEDNWRDNWQIEGGTWEVGIPSSGPGKTYEGQNCIATVLSGDYPDVADTRLVKSVSFVVPPAAENPRLRFWHWFSFSTKDYGKVQIKAGKGSWQDISIQYTGVSSVWTYPYLDLSAYAGITVNISFIFHSADDGSQGGDVSSGWYIDDIALITGPVFLNTLETWEDGLNNWSPEKGTWEVGQPAPDVGPGKAYSGQNCAATVLAGDYTDYADARLISPVFIVPAADQNPRLRFWHWYSFSANDYGKIQIKVGNGSWQDISAKYTGKSGVWTYPYIDLSNFSGMSVRISFYFRSADDNFQGADVSAGWYIDEVTLLIGSYAFNSPEKWENGLGDWNPENGTWEIGIPKADVGPGKAFNGENCAATVLNGDYNDYVDSRLTSPQILVPPASQNPRLRFWHWYNFSSKDYGKVQVKRENGTWEDVSLAYTGIGSVWTYPSIDLSAYAGTNINIAFYFHAGDDGAFGGDVSSGWYIDDVALITGATVFNYSESWETGLAGDWSPERGVWEVGTPQADIGPGKAYSQKKCLATVLNNNYPDVGDSRFVSPKFTVPPAHQHPRLRFWHWYSFSTNDYGKVQIKIEAGNWQNLSIAYIGNSSVWTLPYLDLSPYAEMEVVICFYFHSAEDGVYGSDVSAGWYIDDVSLITGDITLNTPEDWESGLNDWNPERGTWEIGTPELGIGPGNAFSGLNCAATVLAGNYTDYTDSRLISPLFIVPSVDKNPRLRFWHWYGFSTSDYGKVQIKTAYNKDWKDLAEAYFTGTSVGNWLNPYLSLSAYADSLVQLAFYFHAGDDGSPGSDVQSGWYVDDIEMIPPPIPATSAVESSAINQKSVTSFALSQNYPNPFNPMTTIEFALPNQSLVAIKLFDITGKEISTIIRQNFPAGKHKIDFNAQHLASGLYFYQIQADNYFETRKMVLMK